MKKVYRKPSIRAMEAITVSLMEVSPLQEAETTSGGGIYPDEPPVNTGLSREHHSVWDE